MTPYSWIVGSQSQAALEDSAKMPPDRGFLVFLPKEGCSIKEKLYFFPKIEFGNSTDVLATNSNTVVMAGKPTLPLQTSILGCTTEM